jgi:hypothetical protein
MNALIIKDYARRNNLKIKDINNKINKMKKEIVKSYGDTLVEYSFGAPKNTPDNLLRFNIIVLIEKDNKRIKTEYGYYLKPDLSYYHI